MLPTPIELAQPEAYERAPTLMGGETPGSQGEVRVWEPDKKRLRRTALLSSAPLLINLMPMIYDTFRLHLNKRIDVVLFTTLIVVLIASLIYIRWQFQRFLRQPRFVSADGAGIGVTTRKGSRYVRWMDVVSAELCGESIILNAPDKIFVDLAGYPEDRRKSLLACIYVGAGLHRSHEDFRLFVRPGDNISCGKSPTALQAPL